MAKQMRASELPLVEGADHWMVRGSWSWGRDKDLREAIRKANLCTPDKVHVCRCDGEARCEEIEGNLQSNVRGAIWSGIVTGRKSDDIRLVKETHPAR